MKKEKEIWKPLIHRSVVPDRYLISSIGRVKGIYRINRVGDKFYFDKPKLLKPYTCQQNTSLRISLITGLNKTKAFYIPTLMINIFKIKKPNDPYNNYRPYYIDGNFLNNDRNNIGFKKFTKYKINGFKHEPINFIEKGKLIAKICGKCGKKKTAEHFMISCIKDDGTKTLKNKCVECSCRERWKQIKSDPVLFQRYLITSRAWNVSKKGRKYHLEYDRERRKELTDWYVKGIICMRMNGMLKRKDIPKEMVEMYRTKIITTRLLRKLKTNI